MHRKVENRLLAGLKCLKLRQYAKATNIRLSPQPTRTVILVLDHFSVDIDLIKI